MLNVILIDDEELARKRMHRLLDEIDQDIRVLAEASNGKEAIQQIRNHKPDLIFLDIQMPVLDGFDVVDLLAGECPPVIFVTAYDEYALKAFDVHAIDYLLKPVRKERLKPALEKVKDSRHIENQFRSIRQLLKEHAGQKQTFSKLPVNHKNEILFLDFRSISYFEADGKLTWVHTTENNKYRTDFSLNELESRLEKHSFLRIHRSWIVNLEEIKKLEPWFNNGFRIRLNDGTDLEVARRRTNELKVRLGIKLS